MMIYREHLDYFGVAATAYLLLFTTYMDIVKVGSTNKGLRGCAQWALLILFCPQVGDRWEAKGSFKRWWNIEIWKEFFAEFLNIKGSKKVQWFAMFLFVTFSSICNSGGSSWFGGMEDQVPEAVLWEEHGEELREVEAGREQGTV